ncbi:MAG: hypothetical protein ACK5C4_09205 [Pseudanabaena sp.]
MLIIYPKSPISFVFFFIHATKPSLIVKSKTRLKIAPDINSFEDPELKSRAKKDYHTLKDEIEGELPDFDELFQKVADFYRSLPWS